MDDLTQKRCVPCEGGVPPMTREETEKYLPQVKGWQLSARSTGSGPMLNEAEASDDAKIIWREFKFRDFKEAMTFVNKVAELAESEGHHPDVHISWNKVKLGLTTHAIKGLSENDFILAAKINGLAST